MANIISSAIVNKPPPPAVANLLARRNKLHHLDQNTDETLMKFFDTEPGHANKFSSWNHVTMPSRNWAVITENSPSGAAQAVPNGYATNCNTENGTGGNERPIDLLPHPKDGHSWLHPGEVNAGTKHKAADSKKHGQDADGSLDVCIRVEMDQHDREGKTQGYGMTIPVLVYQDTQEETLGKRDAVPGAINQRT